MDTKSLPAADFRNQNLCTFCKRNKEPESVYRSHKLKDSQGNVTCPQLFKYRCELCGSTGKEAHTRSYCPVVSNMRNRQASSREPSRGSANSMTSGASSSERCNSGSSCSLSSYNGSGGSQTSTMNPAPSLNVTRSGMFRNMGRVTNSRYNAAGRLRHNPNNRRPPGNPNSYPVPYFGAQQAANFPVAANYYQSSWATQSGSFPAAPYTNNFNLHSLSEDQLNQSVWAGQSNNQQEQFYDNSFDFNSI